MNATERAELLDQLAAGQISLSEAMHRLDQSAPATDSLKAEQQAGDAIPVEELKAEEAIAIRMPEEPVVYKEATVNGNAAAGEDKPRWLKIRVRNTATGQNKVSITLPLGVVRLALALGRRFSDDMANVDTDELMTFFKSGQRGILVEAQDDEDNEHVQIYLD